MSRIGGEGHEERPGVCGVVSGDPAQLTVTNERNEMPIHVATAGGHVDVVRLLLDRGAQVAAGDNENSTALDVAAIFGHLDLARFLAERGVDPRHGDINGMTPLHFACYNGNADIGGFLIGHGADVRATTNSGSTPLHDASFNGDIECMNLALDGDAIIDATEGGFADVAARLIERGADVHAEPPDGMTALMRALDQGHLEMSQLLLDSGVDVNAADPDMGRTALHTASLRGWPDVAGLLLEKGADLSAEDAYGMTPLEYAGKYGHRDVAELLQSRGAAEAHMAENYGRSPALDKSVKSGQASLWYLGHCGWAVKTEEHFLIFDYWSGAGAPPATPCITNGHIDPSELSDEHVYVFVTHEHGDHYDPVIHEWSDALDNVTYVYGFRPELTPQYRTAEYDGPEYEYVGPREYCELDGLKIRTVRANDGGVGFLIEVDGLSLYHAGDHAGWADGERDGFFGEIDYLAPHTEGLDLAFLNVTGCHSHDPDRLLEGNVYTLDVMNPNVLIPTHAIGREYIYAGAAERLAEEDVRTSVCCPKNRGDSYFYNGEAME
ncbi:MAG: ankyrin repeat domain-containing protein [Candidatus Eisenbacteria bacterium]